jgi:hypothetical protein
MTFLGRSLAAYDTATSLSLSPALPIISTCFSALLWASYGFRKTRHCSPHRKASTMPCTRRPLRSRTSVPIQGTQTCLEGQQLLVSAFLPTNFRNVRRTMSNRGDANSGRCHAGLGSASRHQRKGIGAETPESSLGSGSMSPRRLIGEKCPTIRRGLLTSTDLSRVSPKDSQRVESSTSGGDPA